MRQRKNLNYLPPNELERYRAAVLRLQGMGTAPGSFSDFATIHKRNCGPVHFTRLFLPWHRAFLDRFEQALRSDPSTQDVTVPYWDWWQQDPNQDVASAFGDDMVPVNGELRPNPLKPCDVIVDGQDIPVQRYTVADRQSLDFPALPDWNQNLAMTTGWPAFGGSGTNPNHASSGFLEKPHGTVHHWVGNTMGDFRHAPADPIFWSHHSFVDYLWWTNQPAREPSGVELKDALPGLGMVTGDVVPIGNLDYEYVVTSTRLPIESVPAEGAVLLRFRSDLPPYDYRSVRLTLHVRHVPNQISTLKVHWGQDLERTNSKRPADGITEFIYTLALFGVMKTDDHAGHGLPMTGFNQVLWLSPKQIAGLTSSDRAVIPVTVRGYDLMQRKMAGAIEFNSVELAFLP